MKKDSAFFYFIKLRTVVFFCVHTGDLYLSKYIAGVGLYIVILLLCSHLLFFRFLHDLFDS